MKTTLTKIELLGEVLDFADFATQENLNSAKDEILTAVEKGAKESTLLAESAAIKKAIADKPDVDLSGVAKEETLQEVKNAAENIDLTPIENKVDEGVSALSTKIDNIDLSSVAKQGENQEATNTAILEGINKILSRSAVYNSSTGDLTFENVDIIIE